MAADAFRCRHGFGCLWKSSRLGERCDGPRSPHVYNLSSYRWGRLHHHMHSTRGMAFVKGGWAGRGRVGDTWMLRKGREGFVLLQAGRG